MRAHRFTVASACLLAVACSRGPRGKAGQPGAPGGPGSWASAPRITSVTPGRLSWGSTMVIEGQDFPADPAQVEVWAGGVKGDVVSASTTSITATHLAAPDVAGWELVDLVVFANGQMSNPAEVRTYPSGAALAQPLDAPSSISAMVPLPDGSVALFTSGGRLLDVTADGDISQLAGDTLASGAFAPVSRMDGIYYLTSSFVRRWYDTVDYQVMPIPAGDLPRALAFDGTGNLYLADYAAPDTNILVRDYVTGAVTTLVTLPAFDARTMVAQGGNLFVWGLGTAANPIKKVPIATPASNADLVADIDGHTMIGDGTQLYVGVAGLVTTVSTTDGTQTTWSGESLGTGNVDEIARDADGDILYRIGDRIWEIDAAMTTKFTAFAMPFAAPQSIGGAGALVAGDGSTCGVGSSKGGVLYEVHDDGTLRHIVADFCGAPGALGYFAGQYYDVGVDGSVFLVDLTGDYIQPLTAVGVLSTPLFVVVDGQGNLLVPNADPGGGWRVSELSPTGAVVNADFVPAFPDRPDAGVVANGVLYLAFPTTRKIDTVALPAGGALSDFGDPGFRPVVGGMSLAADGRILVTDLQDASLWAVASDGTASLLGPAGGDDVFFSAADGSFQSASATSIDVVMP